MDLSTWRTSNCRFLLQQWTPLSTGFKVSTNLSNLAADLNGYKLYTSYYQVVYLTSAEIKVSSFKRKSRLDFFFDWRFRYDSTNSLQRKTDWCFFPHIQLATSMTFWTRESERKTMVQNDLFLLFYFRLIYNFMTLWGFTLFCCTFTRQTLLNHASGHS